MTNWTAPEDGWYLFGDGEPRRMTETEVRVMLSEPPPGDVSAVCFETWESGRSAFAWAERDVELPSGQVIPQRMVVTLAEVNKVNANPSRNV